MWQLNGVGWGLNSASRADVVGISGILAPYARISQGAPFEFRRKYFFFFFSVSSFHRTFSCRDTLSWAYSHYLCWAQTTTCTPEWFSFLARNMATKVPSAYCMAPFLPNSQIKNLGSVFGLFSIWTIKLKFYLPNSEFSSPQSGIQDFWLRNSHFEKN